MSRYTAAAEAAYTSERDMRFLVADVVEILEAAGWHRTWAACRNSVTDEMGTTASLHHFYDTLRVEVEYALPGVVETLSLDPKHGATRVAKIILAAAEAPED
jgi:hypothetical protein